MKLSLASGSGFRFLLGLGLAFTGALRAQDSNPDAQLNPQQVDQLLGPIALYPDALVALILPASTQPADVVLAARYLSNGGDPDKIDDQPWNDSIKALARYPMLVKWMDDNLTWTRELGTAFLNQSDEVMTSVQRLRTRARANGALTSTPQQKLMLDGDDIEIVPAQPDVIYVPYYDPNLVYGPPGYYGGPPYLTFGLGLPIGFWLSYDFNWRTRVILIGDRHHNWNENRDWNRHPGSNGNSHNGNWHAWTPPVTRPPSPRPDSHRPRPEIVRPNPLPGAPPYPQHDQHPDRPRPDANSRDSDHNRPPTPAPNPTWTQDNRDKHAAPPRPEINPAASNPPRPTGPTNQPPPLPVNPPGRQDSRDNHDRRPPSPPPAPGPEIKLPPSNNPPRPSGPAYQPPPTATRQAPSRPEPRPEPRSEPRPVNNPPPPAPPSKDTPQRDKDANEAAR